MTAATTRSGGAATGPGEPDGGQGVSGRPDRGTRRPDRGPDRGSRRADRDSDRGSRRTDRGPERGTDRGSDSGSDRDSDRERADAPPRSRPFWFALGLGTACAAIVLAASFAGDVPVLTTQPLGVPVAAAAADLVCPGPETLVAPEGGEAVSTGGRTAVSAVVVPGVGAGGVATAALHPLSVRASGTPAEAEDSAGSSGAGSSGAGAAVPEGAFGPDRGTDLGVARRTFSAGGASSVEAVESGDGGTPGRAPTIAATQVGLATGGDLRGLVTTACAPAVADSWLVGGSTATGHRSRLLLANPLSGPAVVDLTLLGPDGPVEAPQADGLVVPPGGQIAVALDALAPDLDLLAVHVVARSGRVSSALYDTLLRGLVPGGADDVAPAAGPARRLVVPGVSLAARGGAGTAAVRIAVPGTEDAVVTVGLIGPDGAVVVPDGVLSVAAGAVGEVPLEVAGEAEDGVPPGDYAVVVESDSPVTAAVRVGRGVAGSEVAGREEALGHDVPPSEFAWAAAVEALDDPAVAALPDLDRVGGSGAEVRLVLAATSDAAVPVRFADASGDLGDPQTVSVASGTTATVPAPEGASAVLVGADAGLPDGLHVAVVVETEADDGPMISVFPVRSPAALGHGDLSSVPDRRLGLS